MKLFIIYSIVLILLTINVCFASELWPYSIIIAGVGGVCLGVLVGKLEEKYLNK